MSDLPQVPLLLQRLNYIAVATFTLVLYDSLLGIAEDVHTIPIQKARMPDIVYVTARLLSLGEAGTILAAAIIPPNSCHKSRILLAAQVLSVLVAPCNTWLFLLRVRAIPRYPGSRLALYTCGILWLLTCSSPLIFRAFRASDVPIGDGTCVLISQFDGTFLSLPMITVAVFDSAIVVFVSLGLVMNTPTSSWVSIVRPALLVNGMGSVSRALLRSGQIYYLATIGVHLSMVIITLGSTISAPYVSQLALLTSIFHTIMTCRVFRLLRLTYRLEVESRSDIDSSVLFMTPVQSDPHACTTAT